MSSLIFKHGEPIGERYGVELEIEADGLYSEEEVFDEDLDEYRSVEVDVPSGWTVVEEHSIQGAELIFAGPRSFNEGCALIEKLYKDIQRQGYEPRRTPRGSTHVHVNVSDLTWKQLGHFVMAAAWAEPYLIELAGKGRKGNLFALSYATAPNGWADVIESIRHEQRLFNFDTHYMAINFRQIVRHGTVEFRMGPSMRNAEEAIAWFEMIREVAVVGRNEEVTADVAPAFVELFQELLPPGCRTRIRVQAERQARDVYRRLTRPPFVEELPLPPPLVSEPLLSVNEIPASIGISDLAAFLNEYPTLANSIASSGPSAPPPPPFVNPFAEGQPEWVEVNPHLSTDVN